MNYLPPNDEVFSKEYQTDGQVRFGETQDVFGASIYDLRSVGKDKSIHWEYEKETRIMCQLSNYISDFDSIFLCINDGFFKDTVSYTHLDVYKRQGSCRHRIRGNHNAWESSFSKSLLGKARLVPRKKGTFRHAKQHAPRGERNAGISSISIRQTGLRCKGWPGCKGWLL